MLTRFDVMSSTFITLTSVSDILVSSLLVALNTKLLSKREFTKTFKKGRLHKILSVFSISLRRLSCLILPLPRYKIKRNKKFVFKY